MIVIEGPVMIAAFVAVLIFAVVGITRTVVFLNEKHETWLKKRKKLS